MSGVPEIAEVDSGAAATGGDLWAVPGQEHAVAILRGAVERGEIGHAWAFTGPSGVGQEQAARALAAALNCPFATGGIGGEPGGAPCGACSVCARCARGAFAALEELAPTGTMHRVADVRDRWLPTAARTPLEGRWKVLHVQDADRMNESAANAFLKGLEEPPPATTWILDVADPDELPDTILSRCREVRFAPWGPDTLTREAAARGVEPADLDLVVRASLGSPDALERLCAPGGLDDYRAHRAVLSRLRAEGPGVALLAARALDDEAKRRTAQIKAEGKAELAALEELYGDQLPRNVAKQLADRSARREREVRTAVVQAALDDLLTWLRDCLVVEAEPGALVNVDAVDRVRADAAVVAPAVLLRAADLVLATREALELNVQVQLAVEALLLQISTLLLES